MVWEVVRTEVLKPKPVVEVLTMSSGVWQLIRHSDTPGNGPTPQAHPCSP